jgi:hypothetical protein
MNGYLRAAQTCLILVILGGLAMAAYACWSMWWDSITCSKLELRNSLMSRHNAVHYDGWLTADDLEALPWQAARQYRETVQTGLFLGRRMRQRTKTMLILSLSMSGIGLTGHLCLSRATRHRHIQALDTGLAEGVP